MKNEYLYVFADAGSRYVLGPLAEYMRKQEDMVLEIDTEDRNSISKIMDIPNRDIVYITSDHLALDEENFYAAMQERCFSVANLEIMERIKPVKSILYTHDLGQVIGVREEFYVDLFDVVMFPYVCNEFYFAKRQHTMVEEVGWIKKKNGFLYKQKQPLCNEAVYFPSNTSLSMERYGLDGYISWIERTIDKRVPIKFFPGEQYIAVVEGLRKKGYEILDFALDVYTAMETADVIITHGCSSIVFEAAYSGCPVISILDGFEPDSQYIQDNPQLEWVYSLHPEEVMPFIEEVRKKEITLKRGNDVLKPFDYEKAYRLITG